MATKVISHLCRDCGQFSVETPAAHPNREILANDAVIGVLPQRLTKAETSNTFEFTASYLKAWEAPPLNPRIHTTWVHTWLLNMAGLLDCTLPPIGPTIGYYGALSKSMTFNFPKQTWIFVSDVVF